MYTLAIDTSNKVLAMGIANNNVLLNQITLTSINQHSTFAMPTLEKLFNEVNLKPNDIDNIIVTIGPGSYTGIRIGLTIAKTLAFALNKKLYTISYLKALALNINDYDNIIPILDAKGGHIYIGVYNRNHEIVKEDTCILLSNLDTYLNDLNGSYILISDECIAIENRDVIVNTVDVSKLCMAVDNLKSVENIHLVTPSYLKLTQAEIDLKKRNDKTSQS